jgi:hypothetical protein
MNKLNQKEVIQNSDLLLVDGQWPGFHDAEVHKFEYWKGDIRPEEDIWVGPDIVVELELCALKDPFFVQLKFSGCSSVSMSADNPDNIMNDLELTYEERGFYTNGEPLPPYILARSIEPFGFKFEIRCFNVAVIKCYEKHSKKA